MAGSSTRRPWPTPSATGRSQGAGIDVFAKEPTTESPLFELPSVVVAPHLGASTVEAQDKAGVTIAEQVKLALAGDFVPFAVNVNASDVSETVRPFMGLAEQLGRILAGLEDGLPNTLEIEYQGGLAGSGTGILTLSVLKGLFAEGTDEPVSYVNAPQLAAERGLEVRETSTVTAHDFVNLSPSGVAATPCRAPWPARGPSPGSSWWTTTPWRCPPLRTCWSSATTTVRA